MMIPGSVDGDGNWIEPSSLARSIEAELVVDELTVVDDETPEVRRERRRGLAALSRGIVKYLKAAMTIDLDAGDIRAASNNLGRVPASNTTFNVVGTQVDINAGTLRAAGSAEAAIPPAAVSLTGKVS